MRRFVASIAICLATSVISFAQMPQVSTAAYNFAGLTPTQSFSTTNTNNLDTTVYVNPGSNVSPNGLTTAQLVPTTDALAYKGWSNASTASASTMFYSFNMTASSTINLQQLTVNGFSSLQGGANSSHGPTSLDLSYSTTAGGTFTTLGTWTITPSSTNTASQFTYNFSTSPLAAMNLTAGTTIYFELTGYNASNNGNGVFGLQSATGVDAISVPIYAPVPEPTSMIALSCVGLTALGYRFRRKKAAVVQ